MAEQTRGAQSTSPSDGEAAGQDLTRDNQEHELEAERESADAMDADVPQPPDESQTDLDDSV